MRITVIEDNEALASAIAIRLRGNGHAVDLLNNGTSAEAFVLREGSDLIVLDVNLPGKDGFELLSSLRAKGVMTPVIMVTARADMADRITGLDRGADDYLVKPFEMEELEARIRALLRRQRLDLVVKEVFGRLAFDKGSRQVLIDDEIIDVPRKETALLECLLDSRGRLVSKGQLIDHIYGVGADVEDSSIEPFVSRLRSRLKGSGVMIKTARGLGYMLELVD
ncbi:response regulator transcription factor [Marinobacterium sp. LSUCC0821]|nr:response regulator transcription factor [Marinobacterium sp. LSUCC0821]QJD72069.1 response regulator transcription factor [Marinobacterium sp. LSUCC0821]